MTKEFCDRCGKEIEMNCYGLLIRKTLYSAARLMLSAFHSEWIDRKDADLCPECEESLMYWFSNPKEK